ncbi:hypothetical protein NP493_1219g00072 [Ridgeia piscesae]|uniref:C2H2-type domain-containing protein n=1 Tax=Ridgeia piscesae TaxID=27915 RepID=A0AAD9KDJ6_RIDPI|nr:hypothetical protein NP493_1219g00072 [Ridgeia piscesae]
MRSKLVYHIKSKHLGMRYSCTQCQYTFVTKSGLNSHIRHIHENVPRYKCEQCGKGYSDRSNYVDHIATHSGVKLNMCSICQKQFKGKNQLWYHVRTKHVGRRFECTQCQCTFASSGGLKQHVTHIHLQLSRYKCEHCSKRYSNRSNYYDHLATHTGARRNVCSICQKQFTFRPGLKAHMLHFHPNKDAQL